MGIEYKIFNVNEDTGSIEVEFRDPEVENFDVRLNIGIPLDSNGEFPDKSKIEDIIKEHTPFEQFKRIKIKKTLPSNYFDDIKDTQGSFEEEDKPIEIIDNATSNPFTNKIIIERRNALNRLTPEEQDQYIAEYMAALDEFHGRNPKWAQLGYLEKARCISAFFLAGSSSDYDVVNNNIFQLIEIAKVHEGS